MTHETNSSYILFVLYLMECFKYAFNIPVVSDGMYSINLGGLQADLKGGGSGWAETPQEKK